MIGFCEICGNQIEWTGDKCQLVELSIFTPSICLDCMSTAYNRGVRPPQGSITIGRAQRHSQMRLELTLD